MQNICDDSWWLSFELFCIFPFNFVSFHHESPEQVPPAFNLMTWTCENNNSDDIDDGNHSRFTINHFISEHNLVDHSSNIFFPHLIEYRFLIYNFTASVDCSNEIRETPPDSSTMCGWAWSRLANIHVKVRFWILDTIASFEKIEMKFIHNSATLMI